MDQKPVKESIVAQGTLFKGTLTSEGPVTVSGVVDGELTAPALVVTESGSVNGRIKAEDLKKKPAEHKYARQIFQAMRPVFADLVAEIQRSIGFYTTSHREIELRRVVALGNAFRLPGVFNTDFSVNKAFGIGEQRLVAPDVCAHARERDEADREQVDGAGRTVVPPLQELERLELGVPAHRDDHLPARSELIQELSRNVGRCGRHDHPIEGGGVRPDPATVAHPQPDVTEVQLAEQDLRRDLGQLGHDLGREHLAGQEREHRASGDARCAGFLLAPCF